MSLLTEFMSMNELMTGLQPCPNCNSTGIIFSQVCLYCGGMKATLSGPVRPGFITLEAHQEQTAQNILHQYNYVLRFVGVFPTGRWYEVANAGDDVAEKLKAWAHQEMAERYVGNNNADITYSGVR